jgi:hypothetical protein
MYYTCIGPFSGPQNSLKLTLKIFFDGVNDPKHYNYKGTPIFRAPKFTQVNIEKKLD